jgi:hypothetical protein
MRPDRAANSRVSLSFHVWALWVAFAAVALSATKADPDLWGHVRFGLDWWRAGALSSVDPYSFTQDRPWVNHEWLSEAFMAAAYSAGRSPGLGLLKVLVLTPALLVLARRLQGASLVIRVSTLSLAIACVLPITLTVRPQLWSIAGLTALIPLIDSDQPPRRWHIIGTAALFAAWANFHWGWITGAAVLCVYAFVRVLRDARHMLRWTALVTSSLGATLVNPYGIGLWQFLGSTVRPHRADIGEWLPLTWSDPVSSWVPVVAISTLAVALTARAATRPRAEVGAVLLLLLAGSIRVNRVAPLMVFPALALLGSSLRLVWTTAKPVSVPTLGGAAVLFAPVVVALVAAAGISARALECFPIRDGWAPDRAAAAHLQGLSGRLLTTFDWGQYAIWHFGPALRVSIDGRRETVYSDTVVQGHLAFERGERDGQTMVAALSPDYAWLRSSSARKWLEANGYRVDIETESSFIAVRRDRPAIATSTDPLPACFP